MLSPSLGYLKNFSQFIVYKLVPNPSRPKPDKVPVNPWTGDAHNPHDPQIWMSYEAAEVATAISGDFRVGFVLTKGSGLFVLDTDGAVMPDGQWHPLVSKLTAALPRAAFEISVSNTGNHRWGRYEGPEPEHGCGAVVEGLKLELYTSGRFIALGDQTTAIGDAGADCTVELTALIATYFPPRAVGDLQEWTTGPCEGWNGPDSDAELIRRAMQSRSSGAAFGNRASFADLWLKDERALGVAYPDAGGRAYDASKADAALASHLAFWTGCDAERIERIMRRPDCGLIRDKWDTHPTYLREFTIIKAVSICGEVCNDKRHVEEAERRRLQIEKNIRIGGGSHFLPMAGEIALDEMLRRFAAITESKEVVDLDNPRRIFSEEAWKASLDASRTVVEVEGSKPKTCATTALWKRSAKRLQVDTVTFRPGGPLMTYNPDDVEAVNTWRPFVRPPATGAPELFLSHIGYLWGAQADHALNWLAHIEQFPGRLPHTHLVHISTETGTGRNWLVSVLCRVWAGLVAANFDLAGSLRDSFNGALSRKLLAVVDEINEGGSNAQWQNAEKLKSMVTTDRREINPKFGRRSVEFNTCRWLILSNHTSALPLTDTDRRFHVHRNDLPPMPPEYYTRLYAALDDPDFINSVSQFLLTRDITGFNPNELPEMTDAKRDLIAASRSEADETLSLVVKRWPGDVISNAVLGALVTGETNGKLTNAHRHPLERARIRKLENPVKVGTITTKVSILRRHERWENAGPDQIRAELAKSPVLEFGNPRLCLEEISGN